MKKILYFLFAITLFSACSSDDQDEFKISFQAEELQQIEGTDIGKYLISTDAGTGKIRYAVYVPYADITESISHACDATCPNKDYPHSAGEYIRLIPGTEQYFCPQCHAMYSLSDGKPLNEEAGKFLLPVYTVSYNSRTKMFHLEPK